MADGDPKGGEATIPPHDQRGEYAARWLPLAEDLVPALLSSGRAAALDRFERDYASFEATLTFLVEREDVERAVHIVRALREVWGTRGRVAEGQAWVVRVLSLPADACRRRWSSSRRFRWSFRPAQPLTRVAL